MDDEIPHPIENEDGNVAPAIQEEIVEQRQAANLQQGPTPEDIFNRLVQFEEILQGAWTDFQMEVQEAIASMGSDLRQLRQRLDDYQESFRVGSTVYVVNQRLVGKVTHVTQRMLDIRIDNTQKVIRKKKEQVKLLHH